MMAKKPENVMKLLNNVWGKAKVSADRERQALEHFIASKGENLSIKPWDWVSSGLFYPCFSNIQPSYFLSLLITYGGIQL